jgi:hypothetical protein
MRPVCVKCQVEFQCHINGVAVAVMLTNTDGLPYQLWHGDEWKCPGCGTLIVASYGREPIAEYCHGDGKMRAAMAAEKIIVRAYDNLGLVPKE